MTQPPRVVVIGASAGGLDALRRLLANIPHDTGLGFVVLQHHAPDHASTLRDALGAVTELPIVDVTARTVVAPDHVYLVPAGVGVELVAGELAVTPVEHAHRVKQPIDELLSSLADLLGTRVIGIVLSGTADDGSRGLRALRAIGGLTLAQEPATAQFDEMPRSAIAAGAVGIVLPPEDMGAELGRQSRAGRDPAIDRTALERVLHHLRDATGVDFTDYKRATIERRIARRLGELGVELERYPDYLATHPLEAGILHEDLLIHVTEFFRDAATLDQLAARVFPELVERSPPSETIRIWVPGCSTGQEAYSIAMLAIEFLDTASHRPQIQIFGTDLSEQAIETARLGEYPDTIRHEVSTPRLERFFTRTEAGWRITKAVRERCIFVRHDLTIDPPFSKLDLISCRNVLIYLGPSLQQGVIPMFHYALAPSGYLLLGPAETVSGFETLFGSLAPGLQLFIRRSAPVRAALGPTIGRARPYRDRLPIERRRTLVDVQHSVDHLLLARYAPACVVIDDDGEIAQFRGRTGAFLEPPLGEPHYNLMRMLRDGLGSDVRAALQQAQRTELPVRREDIVLHEDGNTRRISIEVVPLSRTTPDSRHFVVVFEELEASRRRTRQARRTPPTQSERSEVMALREELVATKEYLHTATIDNASTIEELGAANEELHSMNEELLSTNEELQTTKEELQASNEELETVNEQLRRGHDELKILNDDLVNVLASVDIAIVIVDRARIVRRFTPRARELLNLRSGDIGRAITELQPNVGIVELGPAIDRVIESLVAHENEVADASGRTYRMQVRPYRSVEDKISGAVLSFIDVTMMRHSLDEAQGAREQAAAIVDTVPSPLVLLAADLGVRTANRAFRHAFGPYRDGEPLFEIGSGRWNAAGVATVRERLNGGVPFDDLQLDYTTDAGERRVFLVGGRALDPTPSEPPSKLVGMLDITERVLLEESRQKLAAVEAQTLADAAREKDAFLDAVSHELRTPLNAILLWIELLRDRDLDPVRYRRAIDTIEWSARAEVQLVDDLLDLSLSRDPDQLALQVESVAPVPIVEAALDTIRASAAAKRIEIATELDGKLRLLADPRRLQQIVWHVAANAVKFTPEGGALSVSLSRVDGHAMLSVSDNGKGIRGEDLPLVFKPFRRDRSTTRDEQGLGIGLALVRHLVERQNGTITAASDGEGNGSTFTVMLPLDS